MHAVQRLLLQVPRDDLVKRHNFFKLWRCCSKRLPDLTFFFKAPLEVSLNRILQGRPQLKYHEAGMDLGLSRDIEESFRLFQGRLLKVYSVMKSEFGLIQINANQPIEKQQEQVRQRLAESIDLRQYELDKLS